jgi:hypothetical protein
MKLKAGVANKIKLSTNITMGRGEGVHFGDLALFDIKEFQV